MNKLKRLTFTDILLPVLLVLVGGFHEYIACAASVAMCGYLFLRLRRGGELLVRRDLTALAVGAVCLGYGLSCLWAVDPGMALLGFVKFLPVGLYALCLWQEQGQRRILEFLPAFGAVLAVLTAIGMQIPGLERLFSVADRLAGTFQYPNTFALFLLVCELLVLQKQQLKLWDYLILAVLAGGLLYTGSRTVFVLFVLSNGAAFLFGRQKKTRILLAVIGGGILIAAAVILLIWGKDSVLYRYLSISLTESTFVGRILYMADALKLLLRHPFGMGYMGYYYSQSAVQTGLYAVTFVHNDFLQLLLDVGWIPGGLMIAAVVKQLLRRGVKLTDKLPLLVLFLHSLFDFNLQFAGMFCLLLLLLDDPAGKTVRVKKCLPVCKGAAVVLAVLSLYLGSAAGLSHFRQYEAADALYPFHTQNKLAMLEQETDVKKAYDLALEILEQNDACYVPHSVRAKYAYSQGDFASLIESKNNVFRLNPFGYEEYEEYCVMLINGIMLYEKAGDTQSVQICKMQLLEAQALLTANEDRLSTLGKLIKDQPITQLSGDVRYYIEKMG